MKVNRFIRVLTKWENIDEPAKAVEPLDPFLSPMVDIVPFPVYADALAPRRGFGSGFRYIGKVVTKH